jgi:hypothetical protein
MSPSTHAPASTKKELEEEEGLAAGESALKTTLLRF